MLAVQLVLLIAMLVFTIIVRWTLKNQDQDDVVVDNKAQLMLMASSEQGVTCLGGFKYENQEEEESAAAGAGAGAAGGYEYECAVCCALTSTRCSRCKAVRYCSSKCQIMHWRQSHKYHCLPSPLNNAFHPHHFSDNANDQLLHPTSDSHYTMPRLSTLTNHPTHLTTKSTHPRLQDTTSLPISAPTTPPKKDNTTTPDLTNSPGLVSPDFPHSIKKIKRDQSLLTGRRNSRASKIDILSADINNNNSSEPFTSDDAHNLESQQLLDVDPLQSEGHEYSQSSKHNPVKSYPDTVFGNNSLQSRSTGNSSRLPHLGLKSSFQKVVHGFKASHHKRHRHQNSLYETSENRDASENQNHKAILQYDTFLKLYSSNDVELKPFGLINCGNSCYANAVLQCLAYTRPLTLYLLKGRHSKECWKEEWCFICEFEHLIQKAREGHSPLSPIRILSNISHLGHGSVVEETTLISMTFGGYLHSKIKCMKCHYNSEMHERMMDLTVEIDGDIRSLEQALRRFTAYEMLEGNNKYHCSRCKSYEKAKKKLSVFQAPNILTIVLKRFQAGTLTKLNKLVQFPQKLDMTPFMSRSSDGYPRYNLYAVVVHLDVKSASFCGHYVCYVKNYHEEWFKIDDSVVSRVDLESVLSEEAYILLYARQSPRPTASSKYVSESKVPDAYLQAVPARVRGRSEAPKAKIKSSDPMAMEYQSSRKGYAKDSPYLEEWVTHSVESIPRVNSSSEASSLFGYSEEGTCSTPTTKESASVEDFTDYLISSVDESRKAYLK